MVILLHPYALVLYGIIAWQIEQSFFGGLRLRHRVRLIGRSLAWGALVVIFDDEILDFIFNQFDIYLETAYYYYIIAGFFIDIIRGKIVKDEKKEEYELDQRHNIGGA